MVVMDMALTGLEIHGEECPECGGRVKRQGRCLHCPLCGYSECG